MAFRLREPDRGKDRSDSRATKTVADPNLWKDVYRQLSEQKRRVQLACLMEAAMDLPGKKATTQEIDCALTSKDADLRLAAVIHLLRETMGDENNLFKLIDVFKSDTDPCIRAEIVLGISRIVLGDWEDYCTEERSEYVDFLNDATRDKDWLVVKSAVAALSLTKAGNAQGMLLEIMKNSQNPKLRRDAAIGLGKGGYSQAFSQLKEALAEEIEPKVRTAIIWGMGEAAVNCGRTTRQQVLDFLLDTATEKKDSAEKKVAQIVLRKVAIYQY